MSNETKRILLPSCPIRGKKSYDGLAVWPDLAKFRHFGNMLKVDDTFLRVNLIFVLICNLLWLNCYDNSQIFIVENGQTKK